jgi:hypothetical protein
MLQYLGLCRIDIVHDREIKLPEYISQGSIAFWSVIVIPTSN